MSDPALIPPGYVVWPCGIHMAPRHVVFPKTGCVACERASRALEITPLARRPTAGQRQAGATNGRDNAAKNKGGIYALLKQVGSRSSRKTKARKTG